MLLSALLAPLALVSIFHDDELDRLADLPERWAEACEVLHVPGLSVVVVRDGEVVLLETYGVRDLEGNGVGGDTAFYIASITKTYVATALVRLAEQGEVDLDLPVVEYLPHFEIADPEANEAITVRDLLSHAPGLNCSPCVLLDAYTGEITEERYFRFLSLERPTGNTSYTNLHFTLAGRVIESVTGKPWRIAAKELVLDPLGMKDTTGFADEMYARENVAFPIQWDGEELRYALRKSDRTMHAAGGLGTSARDFARYLGMWLGGGVLEGRELLSFEARNEMLTLRSKSPRGETARRRLAGFGLGWMVGDFAGHPLAQHGGGYVGTAALVSFLPEDGIGVGVLANTDASGQALCRMVTDDVYATLLGMELDDFFTELERDEGRMLAGLEQLGSLRGDNPVEAVQGLSLAPKAYVGTYVNELWGTVRVTLEDAGMSIAVGEMIPECFSTGTDSFRIIGGVNEAGRFTVVGDKVPGIVIQLALGDTDVPFERQ